MLVEDEAQVRELAARVLRTHGYQVVEAADGPAALHLAIEYAGGIHLLLTDVIMPGGMSGRQLAEQMRTHRPGIKVLYMSGYTDNILMHHHLSAPNQIVLEKPFVPERLAHLVWEILQP